ncbi:hypothetical protein SAMN05216276_1002296 [Streptosporangium subroseum]|uniref:Uncharacterized protein n=1 Tax=Streptosporangium subroseum TaxID=106412 RepID=A0A239B1L2_9ACTN|nr:hypothetical protein [Streptosporangium subroseum]SNS01700.1 hypothetical protein SAMN05216276_1002296 [Streptosporangium subroseum]
MMFLGLAMVFIAKLAPRKASRVRRDAPGSLSQELLDRAVRQGTAPDLIYVVAVRGHELVEQSVGVINDEGFGANYSAEGGRLVQLRIDRGTLADAACTELPKRCEKDGAGWYRVGEGCHEYLAVRDDHHIRLTGRVGEVDRATLKAAVAGARPATNIPSAMPPPSRPPVRRGDLPTGDGAPIRHTGRGG